MTTRYTIANFVSALSIALAGMLASGTALAQEFEPMAGDVEAQLEESAFDKGWALAIYGTGWEGSYGAGGIGGKLRWEPLELLGIEVFAEHNLVQHPNRLRHDHPVGFNFYVPFTIVDSVRARVLAGLCANFSFIEGDEFTPDADDIQFGVHAGGGFEVALGSTVSLFFDAMWVGWWGHPREASGWTGAVGDGLEMSNLAQFNGGLSIHL